MIFRTALVVACLGLTSSTAMAQTGESRLGRRAIFPRSAPPNSPQTGSLFRPQAQPSGPVSPNAAAASTPNASIPPARVGLFPLLRRNARQEPPPTPSTANPTLANPSAATANTMAQSNRRLAPAPNPATAVRPDARALSTSNQVASYPPSDTTRFNGRSPSTVGSSTTSPTNIAPNASNAQGLVQTASYAAPPSPQEPLGGEKYFYEAAEAFQQGRYDTALVQANIGSVRYPRDVALRELQALAHFAQQNYADSAKSLRLSLVEGGGWDWQAFVEIYGANNIDRYTMQLRGLEQAVSDKPSDAALRMLLAYHYQVAGHKPQAERQLKQAVALEPNDELARAMLGLPPLPPAPAINDSTANETAGETLPAPPEETLALPQD